MVGRHKAHCATGTPCDLQAGQLFRPSSSHLGKLVRKRVRHRALWSILVDTDNVICMSAFEQPNLILGLVIIETYQALETSAFSSRVTGETHSFDSTLRNFALIAILLELLGADDL